MANPNGATHISVLELTKYTANPETSPDSDLRFLAAVGSTLVYWNGTTWTTVGSAVGGGESLNTAYTNGRTIIVSAGAVTMNGINEDTAVLSLAGDGDSAGALIKFAHTTNTRNDLLGTGSSWKVTGQGAAEFQASVTTPAIVAYGSGGNANLTIDAKGTGTIQLGGTSTGGVTITPALTATASVTIIGVEGSDVFTVTAGDLVVTLGSLLLTDNDNASSLRVTNNTATTVGASAATGLVEFASTSLTTGTLLHLELTEATLNGGFYMKCWDVTAGAAVFTVGENGDVVITGTPDATALAITTGDFVMADGKVDVTDQDNEVTLLVTNNGLTSAAAGKFIGSGVFTGVTTSSFVQVIASGLTTGTLLYLAAAAASTSVAVVDIPVAGLTSGSAVRIVAATANFTTGGKLIELDSTAAVAGNLLTATTTGAYTGTGMILVTAGAATTGVLVSIVSTTGLTSGSLLRATTSTAGALATNGAISFTATGNFTSTTRVSFFEVRANTTTGGSIARISGTAVTDGIILTLEAVEATLTTGLYFRCFDGAANDFSIGKYGATIIAGNAIGTAALTMTAGDLLMSSGNLILTAGHIKNTPQAIVNANTAISIVTLGTTIANNAGSTHTLADGTVGQLKYIVCTVYTADAVITPANFVGTTITLNAAGDSWLGVFVGTEWVTLALGGTAAVA